MRGRGLRVDPQAAGVTLADYARRGFFELADIAASLSDVFDTRTPSNEAQDIPDLVRRLQVIGSRTGMDAISAEPVLSEYVVLAQTRSITVDLLEVCGWSRESALAALAPTSQTPAYPPETWPGIGDQ